MVHVLEFGTFVLSFCSKTPSQTLLFPSSRYTEAQIPLHPCLKLIANSEQALSSSMGRRLITMEKTRHIKDLEEDVAAEIKEDCYQDHNSIREKVIGLQFRIQRIKRTCKT